MGKKKELNEKERSLDGCYGEVVAYEKLQGFLEDNFHMNFEAEEINNFAQPKFSQCIWGNAGIGKTHFIKAFENIPVIWRGKRYSGYKVIDVPIAQFEEMGDLHGMPYETFRMTQNKKKEVVWAHKEAIADYKALGYELDLHTPSRTQYAPPDWVPTEEGPAILLFDDWNRASIRIVKGIMQLLQNYGMVSWKLPAGCNIVLTGNPDEQDYLVTSIDGAILTRIKHVTLQEDANEWSIWATAQDLDPRGISWVLRYPEMMIGPERTNPRTLSEFFRQLKKIPDIAKGKEKFSLHANALLDEETVNSMAVFMTRDMEDVIEPEDILEDKKGIYEKIADLMSRDEPRCDIIGITCQRLFATMIKKNCKLTDKRVKNFQKFITDKNVPEDIRHSICKQLARQPSTDGNKHQQWLLGNETLKDQILEMLR